MLKWLFIILCCLFIAEQIVSQTDILAITSFQTCVSVDSRYETPFLADNASTYINCSTNTATLPRITVVDLSLSPGIGAGDELNFNIAIVPSNVNNNDLSSPDPTSCVLRDPKTQLCTITTPATVKVVSTKLVYKYQLTATNFEFPYCYASVAMFEQFKYLASPCEPVCDPNTFSCDEYGVSCIPVQYSQNSMNSMMQKLLNPLKSNANDERFKLSTFERVNKPYNPQEMACSGYDTNKLSWMLEAGYQSECALGFGTDELVDFANANTIAVQGNLRNITFYNGVTCLTPSQDTSYCRTANTADNPLLYDNPNLDVRVPTYLPLPSLFGMTPSPVYRNLITDPVTTADDIVEPVNITVNNLLAGSVTYGCVGFECQANQDSRRVFATIPPTLNQAKTEIFLPSPFLNTVNSIVALNPMCTLYYITPIPQTFAEITVNVTVNPGTPDEHTETLVINNFEPSGSATSSPYRFVFGRIETTQSSDFIQGPAISGAIMVCGGKDVSQFLNMQCLINGVECNDDQQVTSDSISFSEATNPWSSIMENSKVDMPDRQFFYPHVYDYMIPSTRNGKTTEKYIPKNNGQSIWYYINPQRLINDFGSECNKIGLGEGVNGNQQNANLFCNMEPHACLPGLGANVNGGLKQSLPCKVAQYMNIGSGMYDTTQFPYPYGYKDVGNTININDQFLAWMKANATSFMPTNPFIGLNGTGTSLPLYDPQDPQFWLGYEGGQGGSFLYYSPTTDEGQTYFTNVNVEVVLDIVGGTFLSYTENVAQGKINVEQSRCILQQGGSEIVTVSITNQVSASVDPNPTSYDLLLDCNILNSGSGMLFTSNPGAFNGQVLLPEETKSFNFTVTEASGLGQISSNALACLATLRYSNLVTANSDQQPIDCSLQKFVLNGTYNAGGASPFVADNFNLPISCEGFCNMTCYIKEGKPYKSGCFWIIMIVTALVGTLFLAAVITGLAAVIKNRSDTRIIVTQSQQYLEQEEESSQRILNATDNS
jgi:hypothetical protein